MSRSNLALVEKMYECFNRGDLETIKREVFAENIEWRLPGHHPLSGTKYGADEVIAFFSQLTKSGIKVDLIRIDSFGEDYVVEVHRGYGQSGDAKLDANNCTHYHVVNGRIQDVQVYISDQHTVDLFFHHAYALAPIPRRLAE
ncbi:nuclear transport factor 2 family protein [Pyxidicoccus caerfyrddinensis]|uniref:nuclear transport factor 2 family protein n=1 Tax=Pyxidicoccus caerfyrddinensis TaxID=2709663 RepID=UPI0013DB175F|nr:nuclear transport factor 2 family protein [Pyxidicoccus caerfyrddinensis]